jgi:hypothetical protein
MERLLLAAAAAYADAAPLTGLGVAARFHAAAVP